MGVRRYYNKWRAYYKIDGKDHQEYFDTEKEANARMAEVNEQRKKNRVSNAYNNKKRRDAKNQDLPVGFFEYPDKKFLESGEAVYNSIKCVFVLNGKLKHMVRHYGDIRTREEAIELLKVASKKYIREHKKDGKK